MRLAAIDVGSNSVHLVVCRIRPDLSIEVVDREKDMIRIGAGSFGQRHLPDANIAAALASLGKFKRLAESHSVDEILVVATSAVREADNGGDLITAARRQLGLRIRVISGLEEARLIHMAAAYAIGIGSGRAVTIDIGGGSTEITLGTSARMEMGRSFKLGAIRLAERFMSHDPLPEEEEARLERVIRRETSAYLQQLRRRGFRRVIGTSGTIQAIGALAAGGTRPGELRRVTVRAEDINKWRRKLVGMPLEQRLEIPGLDPRRADLAPAGAVLLDTLLDRLGAEELTLCDYALREGLLLDYIHRNTRHIRTAERYPDVRRRSVIELAERCQYLPDHSKQVSRLAVTLFDATRRQHGLGAAEREWLEYGALLHDVGTHISYDAHHKHAYYLIKNGELRGFDPEEVEIIALIARYHRHTLPKRTHAGYADLKKPRRRAVRLLAAMARLAEGLDRSHTQVVRDLKVSTKGQTMRIRLHVAGDAELEMWAAARHSEALADVLGTGIQCELVEGARPASQVNGADAQQTRDASLLPRPALRRRGHRRIGQDHANRPAGKVADRTRPTRLPH
jgi:exopolyphosphatase/guanosine-5'-triphosphate,3'-diphosphate pyrophosphatase